MAKSKEKTAPASTLERAWDAFERGDAVTARALALKVSAGPTDEDEGAAKRLGLKILEPVPTAEITATLVAEEIVSRTKGPPKPYLFVGVTAALFLLMLLIASRAN